MGTRLSQERVVKWNKTYTVVYTCTSDNENPQTLNKKLTQGPGPDQPITELRHRAFLQPQGLILQQLIVY